MATAKITSLTPEQETRLVSFREEWRKIGTRTGHDLESEQVGRAAVADAYKEVGVAPPSLILYAQSPLQALLMHWALTRLLDQRAVQEQATGKAAESGVDLTSNGSLRGQLGDQLGGQLRGQLRGQLGGQLGDQLWGQLGDQLWGQLRGQLGDQLWDQLWGQLRGAYAQCWSWGQCEAYWSCYYRFAVDIGVRVTEEQDRRLAIWERLARAAFMVFSWRGVSILVQHPTVATFDDRQRLHRTDGPALAWSDGYGVYAVNGVRLSPEIGEAMAKKTITAAQIRDHSNAEVRRVLVGVYNTGDGGRYLRDIGAKVLHEDLDALGFPRRLLRAEMPDDEPFVAVEVTNSTPEPDGTRKLYTLRVHPEIRPLPVPGINPQLGAPQAPTCHNAIASTFGLTGERYRPQFET